jgi:integrase
MYCQLALHGHYHVILQHVLLLLSHYPIKTHTARRTFCTSAILAGMPPYQIMKITGHSSLANFEKYIKMSGKEAAELMLNHAFFKNTILKAAK